MKRKGKKIPPSLWRSTWRFPQQQEAWVNMLRFIDPANEVLLIDVGANNGAWSRGFLTVFPNTEVLAFEPVSSTYGELKKTLETYNNVKTFQYAVSDVNGTERITLGRTSTLASFEKYTEQVDAFYSNSGEATEEVECRTLDSLNIVTKDRFVCLKVDTQGHEVNVFRGAEKLLSQVDLCMCEVGFAHEYEGKDPSFSLVCDLMRKADLYPIMFQDYARMIANYAVERDVIYVKKALLNNIFDK